MDENGERRYFAMIEDTSGFFDPRIHAPDIVDAFEDGQLQLASVDGAGRRLYFTISLDEDGNFDPDLWFAENRHLIVRFSVWEFENRTDELPLGWEPWW